MANSAVLDNLMSALLSQYAKDITDTYTSLSASNYGKFDTWLNALKATSVATGLNSLRLMFCEADGTVLYDSSKGTSNTYANSQSKLEASRINENHNSRIAIIKSLLSASGRGYEVKRSTSTGQTESYLSVRLGTAPEVPVGTIRVSYKPV